MSQLRKDNHYVPKLYLKQWAHQGLIPTYRLLVQNEKVREWKKQSLKGIAFHQHLYTYLSGGKETDEFERWLDREFEGPAEEAIRRVVQEEQMTPEDWRRLVRFAVALDVRTPASLKRFIQRQNETLPELMTETLQSSIKRIEDAIKRKEPSRSEDQECDYRAMFKVKIERNAEGEGQVYAETLVGRRLWIWQMKRILSHTLRKIPRHRWTILHAPSGMSWPTSDNPVVRLNYNSPNDYNFNGGWDVKNGEILLPLSPKHMLYTSIGNKVAMRGETVTPEVAKILRRIIVENADRYVFSIQEDDISQIRSRTVCVETCKNEKKLWAEWHADQIRAEREFQEK